MKRKDLIISDFSAVSGRVGLLGGSFDPVYLGHLFAGRLLRDKFSLDYFVFVPTHRNPLKPENPRAGDRERLEMLLLALQNQERLFVSPIELRPDEAPSPAPSYTVDTLGHIRGALPAGSQLFLFIGSDLVQELPRWRDPERILSLATIVPYAREGYGLGEVQEADFPRGQLAQLKANFVRLPGLQISGRQIRADIARGELPAHLLSPAVAQYIEAAGLYRGG